MKKKKNRKLQRHKPSSSAAVNQLKQANKESSVEAKEEKTATVDTTEDGEVEEDKKPAAVQRVEQNEVAQLGPEGEESLLLEDILLAQEERNDHIAINKVATDDMEEEEDKKPAAVQRVEPNEVAQLGQEERDSLLLEDILLAQEERIGQLAMDEVTIFAVNCVVSDTIRGNVLHEEHQMMGGGTANIGLKWNYKEMGVFLPANPNHPAVHLMKELTFFQKQFKKVIKNSRIFVTATEMVLM